MVKENIMYQQLQKICREKVCGIKVFRTKYYLHPKIAYSYTMGPCWDTY